MRPSMYPTITYVHFAISSTKTCLEGSSTQSVFDGDYAPAIIDRAKPTDSLIDAIQNVPLVYRLLIADDDSDFLNIIVRSMIREGYQIDTVPDGEAAWKALMTIHYDLLITDHKMPYLTGLALIRKLRAIPQGLPCILMSSVLPMQEHELSALVRPGGAFEKSSALNGLLLKVRSLLKRSQESKRGDSAAELSA